LEPLKLIDSIRKIIGVTAILNTCAQFAGRILNVRQRTLHTAETVRSGFIGASALGFETGVFVEVVQTGFHALWYITDGFIPSVAVGDGDGGEG
jgi:hypothetical protein